MSRPIAWVVALALGILAAPGLLADEIDSAEFREGETHREAGRWEAAADAFWGAIETNRDDYMAHVRYQDVSARQGVSASDLAADYDSFVEDYPDEPVLQLHRLRLEDAEARLEALKAFAKEHPDLAERVAFETALVHAARGETRPALKQLAKPVKAGDPYAIALQIRLLADADKAKDAEKAAKKALDHPAVALEAARLALLEGRAEDAETRAQAVLDSRPESSAALLVKAEALDARGMRREAAELLVTARRLTDDAADVLLALADLVGRWGTPETLEQAAEVYDVLLKKEGDNARGIYGLAWVREREEKYEEAESLYRRALKLMPGDVPTVECVGFVLFKQGRISDAQVQFRKAIDLDPGYASAYANMGATHDANAEYSKAIEWYEKLLKLPGQKDNIRGLVNCAFDYEQLGTFPKAEEYLRRAVGLREDDADLHVWLADNLYFQEKWRDAEKSYLAALDLQEDSFYAWHGLGLTFGQQDKWNDAANALEKARKIKPDDADLLYRLGGIYLVELEDLEKALEAFLAYVAAGGGDPDVPDTITEIRKQLGK